MFGCILENTIENTFFTCCSHFLTFSQLPNKHIMSFIPKNSNKTQDSIFSRWDCDRSDLDRRDRDRNLADLDRDRAKRRSTLRARSARSRSQSRRSRSRSREASIDASREIGEIAITISLISMIAIDVDWRDRVKRRSRDCDRRRSARSRSWSTSIGAVLVTGEIAIVVHRCGWFRRSEGLTEQCVCERLVRVREGRKPIEVKITTETNFSRFWLIFRSN